MYKTLIMSRYIREDMIQTLFTLIIQIYSRVDVLELEIFSSQNCPPVFQRVLYFQILRYTHPIIRSIKKTIKPLTILRLELKLTASRIRLNC